MLEADLLDTYGVMEPLELTWRKLMVLVNGLFPNTSRFHLAIQGADPMRALAIAMGRDPDQPKRTVSAEEFLGGI